MNENVPPISPEDQEFINLEIDFISTNAARSLFPVRKLTPDHIDLRMVIYAGILTSPVTTLETLTSDRLLRILWDQELNKDMKRKLLNEASAVWASIICYHLLITLITPNKVISTSCPDCGKQLPHTFKFCDSCGRDLGKIPADGINEEEKLLRFISRKISEIFSDSYESQLDELRAYHRGRQQSPDTGMTGHRISRMRLARAFRFAGLQDFQIWRDLPFASETEMCAVRPDLIPFTDYSQDIRLAANLVESCQDANQFLDGQLSGEFIELPGDSPVGEGGRSNG